MDNSLKGYSYMCVLYLCYVRGRFGIRLAGRVVRWTHWNFDFVFAMHSGPRGTRGYGILRYSIYRAPFADTTMKDCQGKARGACTACNCNEFMVQAPRSIRCDYCGHHPVDHTHHTTGKELVSGSLALLYPPVPHVHTTVIPVILPG